MQVPVISIICSFYTFLLLMLCLYSKHSACFLYAMVSDNGPFVSVLLARTSSVISNEYLIDMIF